MPALTVTAVRATMAATGATGATGGWPADGRERPAGAIPARPPGGTARARLPLVLLQPPALRRRHAVAPGGDRLAGLRHLRRGACPRPAWPRPLPARPGHEPRR